MSNKNSFAENLKIFFEAVKEADTSGFEAAARQRRRNKQIKARRKRQRRHKRRMATLTLAHYYNKRLIKFMSGK